jgi:translation initiation factor 1
MSDAPKPFHNPFAVLGDFSRTLRHEPPEASKDVSAPPVAGPTGPPAPVPRAVVRLERSGRGGKQVTVVDHLDLAVAERERWLKELKAALGCGGSLEGDALMFQGDQRERLRALLRARGVKRVTLG